MEPPASSNAIPSVVGVADVVTGVSFLAPSPPQPLSVPTTAQLLAGSDAAITAAIATLEAATVDSPTPKSVGTGSAKRKATAPIRTDANGQPLPKRRYTFLDPPLITRAEMLVKEQQWGVAAAARHLKVSAGTLYKHFQRAQTVRPTSTKRKGRPQVLTPEDEARVREWAERDSKLSYTKLAALVNANLHKTVSPGTIGRVLKENLPPEPEAIEKFIECMGMAKKKLDVCASLVLLPEVLCATTGSSWMLRVASELLLFVCWRSQITDAVVAIHRAREVVVRVLADSQEAWEQSPEFQPLKDAVRVPVVRGKQESMAPSLW